MAATTAIDQVATRAATEQLREIDQSTSEQLAIAKPYPGGRTMRVGTLMPANMEEAVRLATLLSKSALIPKDMRERPADVLAALMLGADVGLPPMQALQSIAVINGRPSMWGDGMLAVVMAHAAFEDMVETFDAGVEGGTATCQVWRRGRRQPTVSTFSHNDAQRAGLLGKDTYKNYERRMLKMRARSFALRDSFPDALRGIQAAEEVQDIPGEVIAAEWPAPIAMPARLSEQVAGADGAAASMSVSKTEDAGPSPAQPATTEEPSAEEWPAAADKLTKVTKRGPAKNGSYWWLVETLRGTQGYTWSKTIGAQLEAFFMEGTPIDIETEQDTRGEHKVTEIRKFDPFYGGGREVGADG